MVEQNKNTAMHKPFKLHQRLINSSIPLGNTDLSTVLMINESRYPWILLVPHRIGIEEIFQLSKEDRSALIDEISHVSENMSSCFSPHRINIADIGNRVEQLHIHIVARQLDDPVWPEVVWSKKRMKYNDLQELGKMKNILTEVCSTVDTFQPFKGLCHNQN